jgi:glycosyltransferase involved in cell wall biosynthesis
LNQNSHPQLALKIAMLGSFPPLRGLSSYCLEISLALAEYVSIEFISFKRLYPRILYPGGGLKDDPTFPDTAHKRINIKRRLRWYNPLTWILEAVVVRSDLLHAQWWSLPLLPIYVCICGIFKLKGKPIILTVHNVLSHERSSIYKTASKVLFKLGNHFIVHTEKNRQQMMTAYGIASEHISVIPHGSLDFHVRNDANRNIIREELGIESSRKVILLFGAIRPYKGIDTAIEAFSDVLQEVPDSILLIAGKLWQKWDPYQKKIDELGITDSVRTFLDYIPSGEVYKYFEISDLVILPYHQFDSQSGVGTTAVSFRKPMIVTDVGGLPDLVEDRGYVVPPKNPDALAQKLKNCLKDPIQLKDMACSSEIIAKRLSWSMIAMKTCKIYEQLILGRKQAG